MRPAKEGEHVSNVNRAMKDGRYEVSFLKDGKTDMLARYEGTGHRIDTRVAVAQSAMPVKAVGHLEEKYRGTYTHDPNGSPLFLMVRFFDLVVSGIIPILVYYLTSTLKY